MKRPLTGVAIVFASGIWLGSLTGWDPAILAWAVAVVLALFVALHRTRFSLAALLILVAMAGMLAQGRAAARLRTPSVARLRGLCDQEVGLRGIIVTDPGEPATAGAGALPRSFEVALTAIEEGDQWSPVVARIMIMAPAGNRMPLRYGDQIEGAAILRAPLPARNPGVFDWRRWLASKGICFTATIGADPPIMVRDHDRGNPVIALSCRLRHRLEQTLRLGLESEPAMAGVLAGMIIGERGGVPPETVADFQRTGVFHVFAINGLHVGLVAAVVLLVLRLVGIPGRWAGGVAMPVLVLYVFATGAHPGAVRALTMAGVWLIGRMLVRPTDGLNNLAMAALLILVVAPLQLFDGGFILSFTVVAAIVVMAPGLERGLQARLAPDPLLPRQFRPRWRSWLERPLTHVIRLLSCSVAAWIGLLPLLALYFHLFTPLSIVANLVAVPLLSGVIALGLAAILAHAVWPWLAMTFNNANFLLLATMTRAMDRLGDIPHGYCFVQAPPTWLTVTYYALLALLLSVWIPWARRRRAVIIAAPVLAVALWVAHGPGDLIEVTVLDLSDGTALFVNLPGEHDDLLVDGGGAWSGPRVVLPFLRAQGVDRLAAVVLTCADGAHAAGLSCVTRALPVGEALHSGAPSRSKYYEQWADQLRAARVPVRALVAGDTVRFGHGLQLRALHPPRGSVASRREANTLVLLLEYGATRLLLMSDADATVEQRLVQSMPELRAQVMVRRGDQPAWTSELLATVRPEVVVLANRPRPDRREESCSTPPAPEPRSPAVYRTGDSGAVTIRLTPRGYTVQRWPDETEPREVAR